MIAPRHWAILAACAGLVLVLAANWQFVRLAFDTAPGCVLVDAARPAAKPAC
ncbi:hypothetical protein [Pseudotabrizicola sp. 4114]|uniref:hypothetical protein n=1 Tax=Pseudotabrizicola sp. 4114 TaxID=2817731 RepID=UPI002855C80F|nr:hypothetical protein [Pseudorhodobacter sp. 4114]